MSDRNEVVLLGDISDATIRYTSAGKPWVSFKVVTRYTKGDKTNSEFHKCVLFGDGAEDVGQAAKGRRLLVEGRLQTRSYDDKKNPGKKAYSTEVVAYRVTLDPVQEPNRNRPSGSGSRRPNPPAPGFDDPEPGAGGPRGNPDDGAIPFAHVNGLRSVFTE